MDNQDIDTFWSATKSNIEAKLVMLNIIQLNSDKLTLDLKTKILQKLEEHGVDEIDLESIKFFDKMSNSESSNAENTFIASRLIFNFIVIKIKNLKVYNKATALFRKLMQNLKYDKIKPLLDECIANLKINKESVD